MRFLLVSLLFVKSAFSADCNLLFEKRFFRTVNKTVVYDKNTNSYIKGHMDFQDFSGDYPSETNIHIPTSGTCDKVEVKSVSVFRRIGPLEFPKSSGHEESHGTHAQIHPKAEWEGSAFKQIPMVYALDKGELVLKNYKPSAVIKELGKGKHTWQVRMEIFYRDQSGLDKKGIVTVDYPLRH